MTLGKKITLLGSKIETFSMINLSKTLAKKPYQNKFATTTHVMGNVLML